jgi:hypothetical protein
MLPGGDEEGKEGLARKLTAYHVYTKLFTSVLSPARNVAFGLNMAIPLAGGRNTLKGIMTALAEGPTGYKHARMAGAIMDRVIRDAYETSKGTQGTAWDKISGAVEKWHPFMVTERFLRVFAFHAGQYRAESLFRSALAGDKRAIRDLQHELGAERFDKALVCLQRPVRPGHVRMGCRLHAADEPAAVDEYARGHGHRTVPAHCLRPDAGAQGSDHHACYTRGVRAAPALGRCGWHLFLCHGITGFHAKG